MSDESYVGHLSELRKRVVRVIVVFVLVLIASFAFVPRILDLILSSAQIQVDLNVFSITDPMYMYLKVASLVAMIVISPYTLFEIWGFMKPGMATKEIKFVQKYGFFIFLLFLLGFAFSYVVLVPYYVTFAYRIAGDASVMMVVGATEYVSFVSSTSLFFGLLFQLPMIVFIASYIGVVSAKFLKHIRKYILLVILIASAFITPPDPISMGIAFVPLYILFELSIILCSITEKKKKKKKSA